MKFDHDDFDRQFNQTRKLAFGAFIVNGIIAIGILGAIVWVAAHFLAKVW